MMNERRQPLELSFNVVQRDSLIEASIYGVTKFMIIQTKMLLYIFSLPKVVLSFDCMVVYRQPECFPGPKYSGLSPHSLGFVYGLQDSHQDASVFGGLVHDCMYIFPQSSSHIHT